jgi:hypothetical protein
MFKQIYGFLVFSLIVTVCIRGFSENPKNSHREEADLTRPVSSSFEGIFDREMRLVEKENRLCPVLKTKEKSYRIRTYTDSSCLEAIKECKAGSRCVIRGELSPAGDLWAEEFSVVVQTEKDTANRKLVENCFFILRNEMSMNWFDEQLWAACLGADPDCIVKQCRANKELYPEDFVEACGGTYDQSNQPTWDVSRLKVKSFYDLKNSPKTETPVAKPQPQSKPACQFWRAEAEGKGPIHNGSCGHFPGSGPNPWDAENRALNSCRQNAGKSPHGEVCRCTITTPARCVK